jgi:hypothetical protein
LKPDTKLFSRLDNREVAHEGLSSRRIDEQKLLLDPHRRVDTPVRLHGAGLVGSLGLCHVGSSLNCRDGKPASACSVIALIAY